MFQAFNSLMILLSLYFTTLVPNSYAAKFANQFVEFELPTGWVCLLEGAEWVCQDQQNAAKKKDAIIILAAKIQGDQDSLDQYLSYLKNPKNYTSPQGKNITSEVRYARNSTINDQAWVDSLHLESEITGFLTRYLATVKEGIGILVTYSVNKNKYQEYSPMFEEMVKSLKAFRKEGGLNIAGSSSDLFKTKMPNTMSNDTVFGNIQGADDSGEKAKANPMDDPMIFYGLIAVIGLIAIIILKKRKK
jgi:hypothetical protein